MSSESLIVILAVGLIAGWLAGQIVQGTGYGIINDLIIGVVGSFIGGWLLPQLGSTFGVGIVAAIINATIGALLLLLVLETRSRRRPLGRRMGWALGLAPLALSSPFATLISADAQVAGKRARRAANCTLGTCNAGSRLGLRTTSV